MEEGVGIGAVGTVGTGSVGSALAVGVAGVDGEVDGVVGGVLAVGTSLGELAVELVEAVPLGTVGEEAALSSPQAASTEAAHNALLQTRMLTGLVANVRGARREGVCGTDSSHEERENRPFSLVIEPHPSRSGGTARCPVETLHSTALLESDVCTGRSHRRYRAPQPAGNC